MQQCAQRQIAVPDALRWPRHDPESGLRPSLLVRAALPVQLTAAQRAPRGRGRDIEGDDSTRLRVAGAVGRRCVRCCRQPAARPLSTQPELMPPSCMPQRLVRSERDAPPLRSQALAVAAARPRRPLCPSTCRAATPHAGRESNTFPRRAKATSAARLPARHGGVCLRRVWRNCEVQIKRVQERREAGGVGLEQRGVQRQVSPQRGGRGAEEPRACARDAHFARCTRCSAAQRMVAAAPHTGLLPLPLPLRARSARTPPRGAAAAQGRRTASAGQLASARGRACRTARASGAAAEDGGL